MKRIRIYGQTMTHRSQNMCHSMLCASLFFILTSCEYKELCYDHDHSGDVDYTAMLLLELKLDLDVDLDVSIEAHTKIVHLNT